MVSLFPSSILNSYLNLISVQRSLIILFYHHEGHEESENETFQAFLEASNVEIEQQALLNSGQLHVRQQLRFVYAF